MNEQNKPAEISAKLFPTETDELLRDVILNDDLIEILWVTADNVSDVFQLWSKDNG